MKHLLAFCLSVAAGCTFAQQVAIINANAEVTNVATYAVLLEDASRTLIPEDIIAGNHLEFTTIEHDVHSLDFTSSQFWIKFQLKSNSTEIEHFIIETARPITNEVTLYEIINRGEVCCEQLSGDGIPYNQKAVNSRRSLFRITLVPNQTHNFLLKVGSDGEMVTIPIKVWNPAAFEATDANEQFVLGIYYGVFGFVLLIFTFFYLAMRDKTFLLYVLYVLCVALLQFSLDGFTAQYLFPNSPYLASHFLLFIAWCSIVLVMIYAKYYLQLKERTKKLNRLFNGYVVFACLASVGAWVPGVWYEITFPLANLFGLVALLTILVSVFIIQRKGYRVSPFFALAYGVFIVFAIVFILGNLSVYENEMLTNYSMKTGAAFEVILLSFSMAGKYRELMMEKEKAQEESIKRLEELNKVTAEINVRLEAEVKERTREIETQKDLLAEKNKDITDSINYASRIQRAILPTASEQKELLPDSFVLYKPKDIVSGDFYWMAKATNNLNEELIIFTAADCTGHGVPGAFMSIVGNNFLNLGLTSPEVNTPAQALNFLNQGVNNTLKQSANEPVRDGMDIALCAINTAQNKLYYAGAKNPLWLIRNGEILETKGDKHPIGAYINEELIPFTDHVINLQKGDTLYVFSDGFQDQFGGDKGKKFKVGALKTLLLSLQSKTMNEQKTTLDATLEAWRGHHEQVDDICMIGVRI